MATAAPEVARHNARIKIAFHVAIQVCFWAIVLVLKSTVGRSVQTSGMSGQLAMLVGFAVMEFGLIAAGFGVSAGFMEDSEEARDLLHERRALLLGAGALLAAGSSLAVLSLSGPDRLVPPAIGLVAVLILNVVAALLVAVRWRRLDELNRGVARESGYLAFTWFSWVGGTWAILAHLDYVTPPVPLDWLTMLQGFSFIAGLVALARRGGFAPLPDDAANVRTR